MRRLFWKIFGWFWGAMILIGLALYFVVLTTRPDPLPSSWRDAAGTTLGVTAASAISDWEKGGATALEETLDSAGRQAASRFWLFDESGKELSGIALPPAAGTAGHPPPPGEEGLGRRPRPDEEGRSEDRPRRRPPPEGPPPESPFAQLPGFPDHRRPSRERIEDAARKALSSDDSVFELSGPRVIAALAMRSRAGRTYVLAGTMPRPELGRAAAEPRWQLFGGLITLGLSGLICYALVIYLTSPLVALREATRRLAAGDLRARTNAAAQSRRDEVADLGRDFDAMATRIETLVESQRQLLGDISHELRSPLARLSMALAIARRQAAQGKSGEEINITHERIGREAVRLNALIGQLLELTRLESGDAETAQIVDLQTLVNEIAADADFEAQNHQKSVKVTAAAPCRIRGNSELLRSAIENVMRNAVRYTAPGTAVEVSLQRDNQTAMIRVRDHGPGVPEMALERLFEPFYRVEEARDRESGGVGLGLAITERAVRWHGGEVHAANAPDGGLMIQLSVPVSHPET